MLGVVAHGVETELRNDLYAQLQRLDVGFHDDWDSGQLLSRATSDISAIRRFVGWGAIFFVINGVTALVVLVLLARLNALLAFMVVVMAVPLVFILRILQRRYSEASRSGAGRHGRSRDAGRGGRDRYPRDQVLRPPPVRQ